MITKEQIKEKLKEVKDPELGIDIVSLGLIREIKVSTEDDLLTAEVLMTLTTPLCPFANDIILAVENKLEEIGIEEPRVELTFEPPWQPSEELRAQFGI
ncbi:metal-sulfur cluster assembly factor [Patescibacteria group bacterium]